MISKTIGRGIALLLFGLLAHTTVNALTYEEWTSGFTFPIGEEGPFANPDKDQYINGLEFVFGTDPTVVNDPSQVGPFMITDSMGESFIYRLLATLDSEVEIKMERSNNMQGDSWVDVTRTATGVVDPQDPAVLVYREIVPSEDGNTFYRLIFIIPYAPDLAAKILVGAQVGEAWDQIPPLVEAYVYQLNPPVSDSDNREDNSKYPRVVGANQVGFTQNLISDYASRPDRPEKRSWMGWFLWGNGTPPPGHFAGFPYKDGNDDSVTPWDYYVWQYEPDSELPNNGIDAGAWTPVRVDQQPLYMQPMRLNYNWPAGKFGYVQKPMQYFEGEAKYWMDKQIVRGPNLSPNYPYFIQYGDYVDFGGGDNFPDVWRESWLRMKVRPLETLVMVPSVLSPTELLENGTWNNIGSALEPDYERFPYPVFNTDLQPQQQTPFAILTDKMGDWHSEIVWEGTHPGISAYDNFRYRRTGYNQPGQGNYLKMTVAQGSPFVWCEFNASRAAAGDDERYMIFYDLIRQNLQESMDNTTGTDAGTVSGGPREVPGVDGVSYVLVYGDQNNPNQWFLENGPEFQYLPDPTNNKNKVLPGGFNPPGDQSNHTYFAIFYKTDTVETVDANNSGTDAQGNPYFYLKFNDTGKNWFVVGQVPVMRYYDTNVPRDDKATRDQAAYDWADEMGKYAFNFVTDTDVRYDVTNMYKVTTHFDAAYTNPYEAAGAAGASAMTAAPNTSVWALFPHHYQPFTLGPDLTTGNDIVWTPLQTTGIDFPAVTGPPNANRSDSQPGTPSLWDYWHPRGNLKSVVTGSFTTEYPFQNFLPAMPPPKWEENYDQTGIQIVLLSDVDGYTRVNDLPTATLTDKRPNGKGAGASFKVIMEPNTGRVQQVDVVNAGSGYPVGNPPPTSEAELVISAPTLPGGTQAKARIQTDGKGKILAVFMNDKGSGYQTIVEVAQDGNTKFDPAIVVPNFDENGNVLAGPARVITGGAGFDFDQPITAELIGNGSGATATIVKPGEIYGVTGTGIGGFDNAGLYPILQDSLTATADSLVVEIPPPPGGGVAPTIAPTMNATGALLGILIEDPGDYTVAPTSAHYTNDLAVQIELTVSLFTDGKVLKVDLAPEQSAALSTRKPVTFVGGTGTPAVAYAYPGAAIGGLNITGGTDGVIYPDSVEVSISGGTVGPGSIAGTFEMPVFDWSIDANGKVVLAGFDGSNNGVGFWGPVLFQVRGGRGHDAATRVNVAQDGTIASVDVIREGTNYPQTADAIDALVRTTTGTGATFTVNVNGQGNVESIDVTNGGSGYPADGSVIIELVATGGVSKDANPPRGPWAEITAQPDGSGGLMNPIIRNDSGPTEQAGYFPNSTGETTLDTGRLYLKYFDAGNRQLLSALSQGEGYITQSIPVTINVEQLLYDNIIGDYTIGMSDSVRPFGGAFGGESAPDGYGLGNQLSATTKSVNVLYHLQQAYANDDLPSVSPTQWAFTQGSTVYAADPPYTYERDLPVLRDHNPLFTLSGALQSSVEMMQRTVSLLHQMPPYGNSPTQEDPENPTNQTWQIDYFSIYDVNAGRILINPTATIPVYGVVSSVHNPPTPDGNDGKVGLNAWSPGKLWSGFGVSDQWNDQHYFFGYYLGVAGWSAIFDRSWEATIDSKPNDLWASPAQMGTGLEQWYLSVAYDPDNSELLSDIYTVPQFTYQKLPFFDQWSGHGWATGVSPGPAGLRDPDVNWNVAVSSGTGNFAYGEENENSVWEGLQAYSAAMLWGAGTDRKSLVDVGLYMLATGITASDLYFQDKNYNMSDKPALNQYSWIPVTTIASADVPENGNNDSYPVNTSYGDGAGDAFFVSDPYFGGEASPGISLYRKFGPTLNNFFYAYPTGSKFIMAYPPTAWTMGISRNTDYMRKWAGAMMRSEWRAARDSALYQPGNWLGMAMTSALSDVPYNPGDEPLNTGGTALDPAGPDEYVKRLWASWASLDGVAGREASRQPAFSSTSTLHFLHALDVYGTPDWTYLGRATDAGGSDDDSSILFMSSFSKLSDDGTSVDTTFVTFNPGWETRYAVYDRMGEDNGIASANISGVRTVAPKKMDVHTITIPVAP